MSKVKCQFNYNFSGSAQNLVNAIRSGIEGDGGTFSGNDQSGNFNIKVKGLPTHVIGTYSISGQEITVDITKKPIVASCERIKEAIGAHIPS